MQLITSLKKLLGTYKETQNEEIYTLENNRLKIDIRYKESHCSWKWRVKISSVSDKDEFPELILIILLLKQHGYNYVCSKQLVDHLRTIETPFGTGISLAYITYFKNVLRLWKES